jgi:methylmalonyl-CoA mutase N-terminal domain/subunit
VVYPRFGNVFEYSSYYGSTYNALQTEVRQRYAHGFSYQFNWTWAKSIDDLGGVLRAIETGYIQREIQKAASDYQQQIEKQERIVVGVNRFRTERQEPIPTLRVDPAIEREQIDRLNALRARRDGGKAKAAVADVESRARSGANLMPAILRAVEAQATVGEISDALRRVFGEHRETVAL